MQFNRIIALSTLLILCIGSAALADSCVTDKCHAAIGKIAYKHAPVAEGDCTDCHEQRLKEHPVKGKKSFELVAKGADLCYQCHDAMNRKKVVHPPVAEGDCLDCHQVHGAANRYLLDVGEDQSQLCLTCHDSDPFRRKFMHGPAAVGACTKCHNPHQSDQKSLLRKPVRETCLGCHRDFAQRMQKSKVIHPPVKEDPCTECHDPHSAPAAHMLQKKMPELCVECHDGIGEKLAKARVQHKPVAEGSCGTCHSVHFSNADNLLSGDEKTVCLGCHGVDNLGKPPLANIAKQLANKKYVHGPIQENLCTPCHDPHGSDNFRLLRGSYPKSLYAPYKEGTYGICLSCHEPKMLKYKDTTIYTNFRNGSLNLHYVHVANKQKGRTCRICHQPHAGNGKKLIRIKGMEFGDWKIPLHFTMTPTGGGCAPGCHRPLKYDRDTR